MINKKALDGIRSFARQLEQWQDKNGKKTPMPREELAAAQEKTYLDAEKFYAK